MLCFICGRHVIILMDSQATFVHASHDLWFGTGTIVRSGVSNETMVDIANNISPLMMSE